MKPYFVGFGVREFFGISFPNFQRCSDQRACRPNKIEVLFFVQDHWLHITSRDLFLRPAFWHHPRCLSLVQYFLEGRNVPIWREREPTHMRLSGTDRLKSILHFKSFVEKNKLEMKKHDLVIIRGGSGMGFFRDPKYRDKNPGILGFLSQKIPNLKIPKSRDFLGLGSIL